MSTAYVVTGGDIPLLIAPSLEAAQADANARAARNSKSTPDLRWKRATPTVWKLTTRNAAIGRYADSGYWVWKVTVAVPPKTDTAADYAASVAAGYVTSADWSDSVPQPASRLMRDIQTGGAL